MRRPTKRFSSSALAIEASYLEGILEQHPASATHAANGDDEVAPYATPLKAKGVGELGISGAAAAIANAVYNATGIRVRDYPITLDKLIDHLPALG